MIAVISGTNRPGSRTRQVAGLAEKAILEAGHEVALVDLAELPPSLFDPASYASKPAAFEPFQRTVLEARGILVVTPEYNGSFPGVLKYFIDMLRFPDSLVGTPSAFIGVAAGQWGALRSVEQLQAIFAYREAHLFGPRLFLPRINRLFDQNGELNDPDLAQRLRDLAAGFAVFCDRLAEPLA